MTADEAHFAAFAQDLENVFKKHFTPGTRVAVALHHLRMEKSVT
jgi:hypothetical protein